MSSKANTQNNPLYEDLFHAVEHFAHVLPAQASIRDFVHHNTLHGFEEQKFQDAMKASHDLTGAYGFWPREKFCKSYLEGRISNNDIHAVLAKDAQLNAEDVIFNKEGSSEYAAILKRDIYRIALLFPLKKISSCQLKWQSEEAHAFDKFQTDVTESAKQALLHSAGKNEKQAIQDLWSACVSALGLDHVLLHPEELVDLAPEHAEDILEKLRSHEDFVSPDFDALSDTEKQQQLAQQDAWEKLEALTLSKQSKAKTFSLLSLIKTLTGFEVKKEIIAPTQSKIDPVIQKQSWKQLNALINKIGIDYTLRGFLNKLTGEDVHDEIVPYLLPYIANWLDEGFAQWHADQETNQSFYQSWKASAVVDEIGIFNEVPDWKEHINSLPDNALDTVVAELRRMSIPKNKWGSYITCLALDLPGWSGMFYWRHEKPDYQTPHDSHVDMMDYIAIRLVLEHLYVRKLSRKLWLIEGNLETIRGYLHHQHAEFLVRYALFNEHLPEYIKAAVQYLVSLKADRESLMLRSDEWLELAQMVWTWRQSPSSDTSLVATMDKTSDAQNHRNLSLHHDGWKLFRLSQHLGLSDKDVRQLNTAQLDIIFDCIHQMNEEKAGFLLLQAYENNYRDKVFQTVVKNHGRGTWANREKRPEAQIFFCMDDREEGVRRHLEHLNPAIETFGVAAFFGVVMKWKGLNDSQSVTLCPVANTPEHEVEEIDNPDFEVENNRHRKRYALRTKLRDFIHQDSHRSLLLTAFLTILYAPLTLLTLVGKIFTPLKWSHAVLSLQKKFDQEKKTRVDTTFKENKKTTSVNLKHGFTLIEQADIVERFLQNNGLISGFSHFVVMMGHYSSNQNNPHTAAYGCGACSGKYSGPNARVFSSMANNPDVRKNLLERNILIPDDCWFIGGEHDTCSESIVWEDIDLIPKALLDKFHVMDKDLNLACQYSAHERCRKLASAPKDPSLSIASEHIAGRGVDFSQARPELGHATIAVGFVGRRHLSQGTFMDRRCFLISYDSAIDPDGSFLERILLTATPVGAGINLEYYFSTVNNEKYGCGSKIVHNLTGLFGVMEGCSSDLRTGLPLQMIEIHEPMRLQLMVEAKIDVLTEIYKKHKLFQLLIGNGWLLLSSKDPDSADIHTFDPAVGWELWECPDTVDVATVKNSQEWYHENYDHLEPALIEKVIKAKNINKIQYEVNNA